MIAGLRAVSLTTTTELRSSLGVVTGTAGTLLAIHAGTGAVHVGTTFGLVRTLTCLGALIANHAGNDVLDVAIPIVVCKSHGYVAMTLGRSRQPHLARRAHWQLASATQVCDVPLAKLVQCDLVNGVFELQMPLIDWDRAVAMINSRSGPAPPLRHRGLIGRSGVAVSVASPIPWTTEQLHDTGLPTRTPQ